MSTQRNNIELSNIAAQHTGVPADHMDPNHPYFPHDAEAQLPSRPFYKRHACCTKKCFFIITGTILAVGLLIASLLIGIRVGLSRCPNEPAPVFQTTTLTSTPTGGTVRVTPEPTTKTTTLHTTPGITTSTAELPTSKSSCSSKLDANR